MAILREMGGGWNRAGHGGGVATERKGGDKRDKVELEKPNWPRLSPSVCVTSKIKMPSNSLGLFHL